MPAQGIAFKKTLVRIGGYALRSRSILPAGCAAKSA